MSKVNVTNEEKIMEAIIANPGSDNKKLVSKTGIGRETIRLTVKKLVAEGKIIANVSGKAITFLIKEKKTSAKEIVKNAAPAKKTEKVAPVKSSATNDRTKIVFNGQEYSKGQFVLAVIRKEAEKTNSGAEIQAKFPHNTHRKYGVLQKLEDAMKKCQKQKRFFIREDQTLKLKDGIFAVCSDWGSKNIEDFKRKAKMNGYVFANAK